MKGFQRAKSFGRVWDGVPAFLSYRVNPRPYSDSFPSIYRASFSRYASISLAFPCTKCPGATSAISGLSTL